MSAIVTEFFIDWATCSNGPLLQAVGTLNKLILSVKCKNSKYVGPMAGTLGVNCYSMFQLIEPEKNLLLHLLDSTTMVPIQTEKTATINGCTKQVAAQCTLTMTIQRTWLEIS